MKKRETSPCFQKELMEINQMETNTSVSLGPQIKRDINNYRACSTNKQMKKKIILYSFRSEMLLNKGQRLTLPDIYFLNTYHLQIIYCIIIVCIYSRDVIFAVETAWKTEIKLTILNNRLINWKNMGAKMRENENKKTFIWNLQKSRCLFWWTCRQNRL